MLAVLLDSVKGHLQRGKTNGLVPCFVFSNLFMLEIEVLSILEVSLNSDNWGTCEILSQESRG